MTGAASPASTARKQRSAHEEPSRTFWQSVPRGVAIFWGVFLLLQVLLCGESYAAWWLGDPPLPSTVLRGTSALYGMLLLYYGWSENEPQPIRLVTWILTGILLSYTLYLVFEWFSREQLGVIQSPVPLPFVLQISGMLAVVFAGLSQPRDVDQARQGGLLLTVMAFDLCLITFPIAHLYCDGRMTDSAQADSLVIFVDDLQSPDHERLSAITQSFESTSEINLYLLGDDDRVAAWERVLADEIVSQPSIQLHDMTVNAENPAALSRLMALMESHSENRRVVLVGRPVQLAASRIHLIRSGWQPTQIAMESHSLTLSAALRSLPQLWLTYLPIRDRSDD